MVPKCLIIDDDELSCMQLKKFLKGTPEVELCGTFTNPKEGLAYLEENLIDILLLDIDMPELTGIELVRSLPFPPYIIFITSQINYAAESYALNVPDYLVKPVSPQAFAKAIQKAIKKVESDNAIKKDTGAVAGEDFIFLKIDNKFVKIMLDDISSIEAERDYTRIFTPGRTYISSVNLRTLEDTLPSDMFLRTHRSYLVNISQIKSVDSEFVYTETNKVPLGPSFKDSVISKAVAAKLIR